jgi:hypothetical protein
MYVLNFKSHGLLNSRIYLTVDKVWVFLKDGFGVLLKNQKNCFALFLCYPSPVAKNSDSGLVLNKN